MRKIASTSDYSKIFETFLRKWIIEDIDKKININQFAGRRGTGTEHLIIMMMDRVQSLLDKPGMSTVVATAIDWMGAFDRLDPTITIIKLINLGVRRSLIPIIMEYMEDRRMTVRYNTAWSKWHSLVGGSPQGSWMGQMAYIAASDDAAAGLEDEDQYKYCDDLTILELIALGGVLTDYNYKEHVPSDIACEQLYLNPTNLKTQQNLNELQNWTDSNLMRLNEKKTHYILFNRARTPFATRLTVNGQLLERKQCIKLLGVWLQEDGGWGKNTQELCKKAYKRVGMLTKLRYAGVNTEDLLTIYKLHIRSCLEYNAVSYHSSLSSQQEASLERCQSVCLRVILQDNYIDYEAALEMAGLEKLALRRLKRCLDFTKKVPKTPYKQENVPSKSKPEKSTENQGKGKICG